MRARGPVTFFRRFAVVTCGFAAAVLMASYIAIAVYTANPWPWLELVHESGDRTLIGTVLYFEHAARELPLDLILGAAVGGSVLFVFRFDDDSAIQPGRRLQWLTTGLVVLVIIIVTGTLWTVGRDGLFENLLQYPTRPGESLRWGGHWRYHLLSHVALLALSFGLAGVVVRLAVGPSGKGHRAGLRAFAFPAALFAALSVVFVPSREPFTDAVFIGHQLRELVTHAFVTIPAAWGVCVLLARGQWNDRGEGTVPIAGSLVTAVVGVLVGLFLLLSGLARSVASQGQTQSLAALVFAHFFEHTLSYAVVALAAACMYESARAARRSIPYAGYVG